MKRFLSALLIATTLFSCSSNDSSSPATKDSTIKFDSGKSDAIKVQPLVNLPVQYADPYISILSEPPTVRLNKYGYISISAGNAGQSNIVPGSMRIVLSAGDNIRFTSLKSEYWKIFSLGKEKYGNTIVLTNKRGYSPFVLSESWVRFRGVVVGPYSTVTANITYWTANNPLLPGKALNASQGNMSATNDNSTTSVEVKK
jgi:hypothetical protein